MRSLAYILLMGFKNWWLELWHKPAKLVLYLLCVGAMAVTLAPQVFAPPAPAADTQMDIVWLKAAFFALSAMFVLIAVQKGLSNGDVIFEMQDVNLLFVSPISPKSILMYGLTQMAKGAFAAGFFILFMGNTLHALFGKGFEAILILFFSFMLIILILSILSLVIYSLTNGRPQRKRWVKLLTAALFAPVAVAFLSQMLKVGQPLAALEYTLRSPLFSWTPFAGWSAESAVAFVQGNVGGGLMFVGAIVLVGAALIAYLALGNIDYYEDVLVATETAFEKKRAIADGQANPEALSNRTSKVVRTGVGGMGASAFFYKHLRESTRASALGLLSWPTICLILGAGALALFWREDGACLTILWILMWMQLFMIGTGRGVKETMSHYIYLVPESSFSKVLWSNLEPVARVLLESILLFGLAGVLSGESPLVVAGCIAVFTLFSLMLLGINYLSMRWFGTELGAGLLLLLYLLAVALLLAPGLIGAVLVGGALGLGLLSLWELLAALACFALSKGVLHHCDIQTPHQ